MLNSLKLFKTKQYILFILVLIFFHSHSFAAPSSSSLNLSTYIQQVKGQNTQVKSAQQSSEAGVLRSREKNLILSPTFYSNLSSSIDGKRTTFNFINFDYYVTQMYTIGVSKTTSFGLDLKFHYDLVAMYYTGNVYPLVASQPGTASALNLTYTNASPMIEFRQNLWRNGFGRQTQAQIQQTESQALASSYSSNFQKKLSLVKAETSYWRLVVARQAVAVQKEALNRAQKIYEWNLKRGKMQLAEKSDILQSEALYKTRELDLISAQNEVRAASREFNSIRNLDSEIVKENLSELKSNLFENISIPARQELRDDVKSEQEKSKSIISNADILYEKGSPQVDVYAKFALNGQVGATPYPHLSNSIKHSLSTNHPTYIVGMDVSIPLSFGSVSDSLTGLTKEKAAAELSFTRKLFDQEQDWKNLTEKLNESKKHLELSKKLETLQEDKLEVEKKRFKQGRTTTYQVLIFEQDFLQAQLIRIRDQGNILNIIAEMKQFGEAL